MGKLVENPNTVLLWYLDTKASPNIVPCLKHRIAIMYERVC